MAKKGDLIFVSANRVGGGRREGEIVEVIEGQLHVRYRVRWTDGHETLFAPGAGTVKVEPAQTSGKGPSPATAKRKPTVKKPKAK